MVKEPDLSTLLNDPDKAFKILYSTYKSDFLAFARTFFLKDDVSVDIYQDTFLSFYENLLNGKITVFTSTIKTYIFSIGKFKIYEHLRTNSKLKIVDTPINAEISMDNLNLEQEKLSDRERLLKVNFKKLGKQCQLILELFYFKGKTLKDIKQIENYDNTDVVKSQKSRCLKKLKQLLNA